MTAYYNEIDPYAAQWLRNLIDAGHIARGDVDERSIVDVRADDLRGYGQAHFFAGIGGWSIALRLADWPDDRPVWTGSCPCQPFSAAGAGKAADDERHLWPAWLPLIAERRPAIVFGEQVEAAIGWGWLDAVFADLEAEGYACGASVLPACGVGAPHIRQRLWFVADALRGRAHDASREGLRAQGKTIREYGGLPREGGGLRIDRATGELADASGERHQPQPGGVEGAHQEARTESIIGVGQPECSRSIGDVADSAGGGFRELGDASQPRRGGHDDGGGELGGLGHAEGDHGRREQQARRTGSGWAGLTGASAPSFWSDAEWIACTDGKSRPVGPGSFPLGHGIRNRASKLRAYGNAIVPQTAAEFIRACLVQ